MFEDHVYNPSDGVSYPANYKTPGTDNFLLRKQGPTNPIYTDSLVSLCNSTEYNLGRLKEKLVQYDPCYEHDMKHWHKAHREPGPLFSDDYPVDRIPKWEKSNGVFTDAQALNLKGWKQNFNEDKKEEKPEFKENKMCYLCSTLDEHKQHLAKRGPQLKAKPKIKPRIVFVPPPPIVKKKVVEIEEKQEILYKIIVRTGDKPEAGTSANVSMSLKGRKGWMKKKPLKKKLAVNFTFGRGTSETFHIKGPNIGELQWLVVEHDGLEKKHTWYLENIEIMNMNTSEHWKFVCRQYLSLFVGDYCIKRELKAQRFEVPDMEYEVTVRTGKESMAGTDANVFLTLYGKKGVSTRFQLKNKSKDMFERGQKDVFHITSKDIGAISNIRLEHDNSGRGPGWLVEQVTIQELEEPGRTYNFPCGQWFAKDEGDHKISRTLYPLKKGRGPTQDTIDSESGRRNRTKGEDEPNQITYEVDLLTGTKRYAGTDANIFIKMFGKMGYAQELEFKDENGKRFEKGATDHFRVRGDDVGDINKIQLRHDNKGMAAGWFCKKIILKRFFSKDEIMERLSEMDTELDENVSRRMSQVLGEDVEVSPRRRKSLKHQKSVSMEEDDQSSPERRSDKRRPSSAKGRGWKDSRGSLDRIREESNSEDEGRRRGQRGAEKKKKISYGGITLYVTDDEDDDDLPSPKQKSLQKYADSDNENSRTGRRSSSKRHVKYQIDSDDEVKSRKGNRGRNNRSRYQEDDDSDDDFHTRRGKQSRRRNRKHEDDSDDDDEHGTRRSHRRRKDGDSSDSDDDSRRKTGNHHHNDSSDEDNVQTYTKYKKDRVPFCDEYIFICEQWLAEDEGDGMIERMLKPSSITTFYKMIKSK